MKIRAHYEHISKIPSRGWRAWKNWFLIIATFLDRAIFQSIRSEKMGQKRTGAKMSKVSKITLFMLVDLTNEFLKYVLYLQTFLPGLLPHCNLTYMTSEKNYLISSISFDMSYLKITFQTQFSETSNTLISSLFNFSNQCCVRTYFFQGTAPNNRSYQNCEENQEG